MNSVTLAEAATRIDRQALAGRAVEMMRAHPAAHDQDGWLSTAEVYLWAPGEVRAVLGSNPEGWACGTTACAAGWLIAAALEQEPGLEFALLDGGQSVNFGKTAAVLLDLDDNEAAWLFLRSTKEQAIARLFNMSQGVYT